MPQQVPEQHKSLDRKHWLNMDLKEIKHKCAWCKILGRDTTLIKHPTGKGYVCPLEGCFYNDKNIVFKSELTKDTDRAIDD